MIALLETKTSGINADKICRKLNFSDWVRIEAIGFSGGIWVLWNEEVQIQVRYTHPQFIVLEMEENSIRINIVVVYASPDAYIRKKLWTDLNKDNHSINNCWMVVGDFNSVTSAEEVSAPESFNQRRSSNFNDWIFREELVDIGYTGPSFTWMRGKDKTTFRGARLDRALCSTDWLNQFPNTKVHHLPNLNSDHSPILISIDRGQRKQKGRFRFQFAWMTQKDFSKTVRDNWKDEDNTLSNTNHLAPVLGTWNKNYFGNIHKRKRRTEARIAGVQRAMATKCNNGLIKLEKDLRLEMEEILRQEEMYWFQQSKEEWIRSGDRNTQYYHAAATIRKAHKKTFKLKNVEGMGTSEDRDSKCIVYDHFYNQFADHNQITDPSNFISNFPTLNTEIWNQINSDFKPEEIKRALFDMDPFKAPGPDGFPAGFYQQEWQTVGISITNQALDFLNSGNMPDGLNDTLITLIPKVENPDLASQFRPISLCNVSYKIITKAMTNRIKDAMRNLIGPEQSSFVPGRQISDNVVIYQEVLHTMRKKQGKGGIMAIKIDLEKAYDRLSWEFIENTLSRAGFNENWTRIIMKCVTTPRLGILWEGEQLNWITPKRGIRQGDSISPFLFVLCIERLSHCIREAVRTKRWKGIKLSRYGPLLSHLLFADDMVLFTEASVDQIHIIKECLDTFSKASGQRVSLTKSQIFFSTNIKAELASRIVDIAGINRTEDLGKYLGVPSLHGRASYKNFSIILDRMDKRLQGWKTRYLSLAGRQVLAQSVLSTIPYYQMQTTSIPVGVCDAMDKKIRAFVWGSKAGERKVHLLDWETVTLPRAQGGLGLRKSRNMNRAFLAKMGWRMAKEKNNLWSIVLRNKYGDRETGLTAIKPKKGASNLWQGLNTVKDLLINGSKKQPITGNDTMFWSDKWIENNPLKEMRINNGRQDYEDITVSNYWKEGEGWQWDRLRGELPTEIIDKLEMYVLTPEATEEDEIYWTGEESGKFTVNSAYTMTNTGTTSMQDKGWDNIWKLRVANRIRVFIWLARHERILCNGEKNRRHLSDNPNCPSCTNAFEDTNHTIRGCPEARDIWKKLVCNKEYQRLESMSLNEWFDTNTGGKVNTSFGKNWPEVFAITTWWIWRWRNDLVFNNEKREINDKIKWITMQVEETRRAFSNNNSVVRKGTIIQTRTLRWTKPPRGVMALNTDGSFEKNTERAGCAGVLRDENGGWIEGYGCLIPAMNAAVTEGWAVLNGITWLWNKGLKKVIIQCDSKKVVDWIEGGDLPNGPMRNIIVQCRAWIKKDWEISIQHILREQNRVADRLAKRMRQGSTRWTEWDNPPLDVVDLLLEDKIGVPSNRECSIGCQ